MNSGWYVAEIVEEITVQDDPRNVVHQNLLAGLQQVADDGQVRELRGAARRAAASGALLLGGRCGAIAVSYTHLFGNIPS